MTLFHDYLIHNSLILLMQTVADVVDFVQDLVLERGKLLVQEVLLGGLHGWGCGIN